MLIGKLNLIHDAYEHAELEIEALTRWKDLLMGQVGPKRGPARVGQRWRLPFCLPCGGPSPHQKKSRPRGRLFLPPDGLKSLGLHLGQVGPGFLSLCSARPVDSLVDDKCNINGEKIILLNFIWIFSSSISSHWINRVPVGARRPSFPKEGWNLIFFLFLIFFSLIRIN